MSALAAILLALAALPADAAPSRAVAAALAVPDARVEVEDVRVSVGASCPMARVEALRPVTGSGEVPLRFTGEGADRRSCQGFAWARVHVTATGLVASRTVRMGEPLEDAVTAGVVELRTGRPPPLAALPRGARAARTLAAGAPVLGDDVREGPLPGEPIAVVVRIGGGLELSQDGRATPCTRGHACAVLPGGRRVEGRLEDDHLLLESP